MRAKPSFTREKELMKAFDFVFGMDEVGRGSLAGPLVAGAVCFDKKFPWFKKINDSKLLKAKDREYLSGLIKKNSKYYIETVDVDYINKKGIGKANSLIFKRLAGKISKDFKDKKIYFLIDGRRKKLGFKNTDFIINGDGKHVSISAASIIAKVDRDLKMSKYSNEFKEYGFSKNKGYGTLSHRTVIKKLGRTSIHRTSFFIKGIDTK